MSKLEELLQGIDIEWKGFGEIASIKRGASPRPIAKYITDDEGGIPWIKIGDTSPNSKYVEKTEQRITVEGSKKSRLLIKWFWTDKSKIWSYKEKSPTGTKSSPEFSCFFKNSNRNSFASFSNSSWEMVPDQ